MSISHKSGLLVSAAFLLLPANAAAQSTVKPAEAAAGSAGLEEIVVTAQQRGEKCHATARDRDRAGRVGR